MKFWLFYMKSYRIDKHDVLCRTCELVHKYLFIVISGFHIDGIFYSYTALISIRSKSSISSAIGLEVGEGHGVYHEAQLGNCHPILAPRPCVVQYSASSFIRVSLSHCL